MNSPLTERQRQILTEAAYGFLNKHIAEKFGIAEETVKNALVSIYDKLGALNRTHAVVIALLNGWIDVELPHIHNERFTDKEVAFLKQLIRRSLK